MAKTKINFDAESTSTPVLESHKELLEAATGTDLAADWPTIRKCIRCLTQGKVVDLNSKEKSIKKCNRDKLTTEQAVSMILKSSRSENISVLEAAQKAVIV